MPTATTASITSVSNNEIVGAGQVIGDSPATRVWEYSWWKSTSTTAHRAPATSANTWSFSLAGYSGNVNLRVRATDWVGNVGDPSSSLGVPVDADAPVVTIDEMPDIINPNHTRTAEGRWLVTIAGGVSDNLARNIDGSSLLVKLDEQSGIGSPRRPTTTITGNRWTIDYLATTPISSTHRLLHRHGPSRG